MYLSALDIEDWERHLGTTTPGEAIAVVYRWECALVALDRNYQKLAKSAREWGLPDVADQLKAAALDIYDVSIELHHVRMAFLRKESDRG